MHCQPMSALGGSQTCAAQIYGFTFTTIAKGAFLIRASIIFTPILCTIAGEAVPVGLWVGALTGFAGSIMISLDPSKADGAAATAAAGASHALPSGSAWHPLTQGAQSSLHIISQVVQPAAVVSCQCRRCSSTDMGCCCKQDRLGCSRRSGETWCWSPPQASGRW